MMFHEDAQTLCILQEELEGLERRDARPHLRHKHGVEAAHG